ncbi:GNAT family N-acetyltransferase [Streptomyces sp. Ru87]|uniref:GNAT family N-acetyltransferase n=1 Tax=Streptomyces sp. Ru87 TaxID=2044307 RepID=UPI000BF8C1F4|nr:GNAT family N-acetyltransferase [Streptomyces sp. Ru87]PGH47177.1 hypothetical protein CRI70_29940 [Streptomyces sp. Ru87]
MRVHLHGEQDDPRGDAGVAHADVGVLDDDVADLGRARLPVPVDRVEQFLGDRRLIAHIEDGPLIDAFHRGCSPTALHRRWGRTRILYRDIERLLAHCDTWISLDRTPAKPSPRPAQDGSAGNKAWLAGGVQVADTRQRRGICTALVHHAAENARAQGAHTLSAYTEASNTPMLHLLRNLGPCTTPTRAPTSTSAIEGLPAPPCC